MMLTSVGRGVSLGIGGAICATADGGNNACCGILWSALAGPDLYFSFCKAMLGFEKDAAGWALVCKDEVISVTSISWGHQHISYAIFLIKTEVGGN